MMEGTVHFILLVAVICLASYQKADCLFTSAPQTITPQKTKELTLHCEPKDQSAGVILAIHVKRKQEDAPALENDDEENEDEADDDEADERGGGQSSEDNDVDKSDEDEDDNKNSGRGGTGGGGYYYGYYGGGKDSRSRYRRRRSADDEDDEFVRATLMSGDKIETVPDSSRIEAEGQIASPAHLSVTLYAPRVSDLGLYECQVTYFDATGSIQVSSEILRINEALELSLDSLEERVMTLENKVPLVMTIGRDLQESVVKLKEDNKLLEQDIAALKKENKDLVASIADFTNELRSLSTRVTAMASGGKDFGGSRSSGYYYNGDLDSDDSDSSQNYHGGYHGNEGSEDADARGLLRSDDLFKVDARMDKLEDTRIHVLEQQIAELREREMGVEDKVDDLEFWFNETLASKFTALDQVHDMQESLQMLEVETVPVIMKNISVFDRQIFILQKTINVLLSRNPMNDKEMTDFIKSINPVDNSGGFSDSTTENANGELQTSTQPKDVDTPLPSTPPTPSEMSETKATPPEVSSTPSGVAEEDSEGSEDDEAKDNGDTQVDGGTDEDNAETKKDKHSQDDTDDDKKEEEENNDESDDEKNDKAETTTGEENGQVSQETTEEETTPNQDGGRKVRSNESTEAASSTSTITTTSTTAKPTPYLGHACYVCGNNVTQEPCKGSNSNNVAHCTDQEPYCITDVYQDGMHRHLYRRCSSVDECHASAQRSDNACATDTFITQNTMKCHFCCTSTLCNDSIKPSISLYKP